MRASPTARPAELRHAAAWIDETIVRRILAAAAEAIVA